MTMAPSTPRNFFDRIVLPSYKDWRNEPLAEHRAKSAVHHLNVMAERMFNHFGKNSEQVYGAPTVGLYRKHLAAHECPNFQLVWDVDDAHKHVVLNRASRQVTRHDQSGVRSTGWGESGFGEGPFGGADRMVVELDNGSLLDLDVILEDVIQMWVRLFDRVGL